MSLIKKWKKTVVILIIIAAAALICGGWVYYSFRFETLGVWPRLGMTFQNCVESLLFNPILSMQDILEDSEFISSMNLIDKIALGTYGTAMVLAPLIDIVIVFSILDSLLHVFIDVTHRKKRILIVGYNDKVKKLVETENKIGKLYLWTDEQLSEEEERQLYLRKVSVKMTDFTLGDHPEEYFFQREKFEHFIRKKKITDILLVDELDVRNIQYYMALSSCSICKEKTIHFYVKIKEFEARNVLQDYFDRKLQAEYGDKNNGNKIPDTVDTHMDLHIFDFSELRAEKLFSEFPLFIGTDDSESKDVHLLIYGDDSLCENIALHAMNQAVFSSDSKICIDIISRDISIIKKHLAQRFNREYITFEDDGSFFISPEHSDGQLRIRLVECSMDTSDIVPVIEELKAQEGPFTYFALCAQNPDENMHAFIQLGACKAAEKRSVPTAIRMAYSEEMKTFLSSFAFCREIYLMGLNDEYLGLNQIIDNEEESKIRKYNAVYDAIQNEKIFSVRTEGDVSEKTCDIKWNKLLYFQRQMNRALYEHQNVKKRFMLYDKEEMQRFWDMTVEGEKGLAWSNRLIDGSFPGLVEAAKTEHRRYVYRLAADGWCYSAEKTPKFRMHDCLCNWNDLVEKKADVLIYDLISSPLLMDEVIN